jgi:hypothetical protein
LRLLAVDNGGYLSMATAHRVTHNRRLRIRL